MRNGREMLSQNVPIPIEGMQNILKNLVFMDYIAQPSLLYSDFCGPPFVVDFYIKNDGLGSYFISEVDITPLDIVRYNFIGTISGYLSSSFFYARQLVL
jgi:hypothetical protein